MGVPFLVGRCISGCVTSRLLNRRIAIPASQEKSFSTWCFSCCGILYSRRGHKRQGNLGGHGVAAIVGQVPHSNILHDHQGGTAVYVTRRGTNIHDNDEIVVGEGHIEVRNRPGEEQGDGRRVERM